MLRLSHAPGLNQQLAGNALVADLGVFGPIQSVRFLGPVDHGIDRDKSEPSDQGSLCRLEKTHWEVYEVKQNRGSSVWLVAATASGSIECIEVAVRYRASEGRRISTRKWPRQSLQEIGRAHV